MPSTQSKVAPRPTKVTLWSVETGESIQRWPVDARGMVECGEYVADPALLPEGVVDGGGSEETEEADGSVITYPGGYRVERTSPSWWKTFGPDGEQVGASKQSQEEAVALVPATHRPPDTPGVPEEHSPGVPLNPDEGG